MDAALTARRPPSASAAFLRDVLEDLRPVLATDDAIVVLVARRRRAPTAASGSREPRRARRAAPGRTAAAAGRLPARGCRARRRSTPHRKLHALWGTRAGRATPRTDRLLVIAPTERVGAGQRPPPPSDWSAAPGAPASAPAPEPCGPRIEHPADPRAPGPAAARPAILGPMQQMYHPDDLASMDPLVLMKNLDHVRMTSRRLATSSSSRSTCTA